MDSDHHLFVQSAWKLQIFHTMQHKRSDASRKQMDVMHVLQPTACFIGVYAETWSVQGNSEKQNSWRIKSYHQLITHQHRDELRHHLHAYLHFTCATKGPWDTDVTGVIWIQVFPINDPLWDLCQPYLSKIELSEKSQCALLRLINKLISK